MYRTQCKGSEVGKMSWSDIASNSLKSPKGTMLETAAYLYFGEMSYLCARGWGLPQKVSTLECINCTLHNFWVSKRSYTWHGVLRSNLIFLQYAKDISLFIRAYFLDFAIRKVFNWLWLTDDIFNTPLLGFLLVFFMHEYVFISHTPSVMFSLRQTNT
jgi:hypothetical protein